MKKKTIIVLLIWYLLSILLLFASVGNITKDGTVYGWLFRTRPGWLFVSLLFEAIFVISGFVTIILISKIKHKKKVILLTSVLVFATIITQQIYIHAKTGRSYSFSYIGPITPKDYGCIHDIRGQMTILTNGEGFADAKMLCDSISEIELSENQPLKDYNISLIHNKETNKIYLYSPDIHETLLKSKYRTIPDKWTVIAAVNKSLNEKPKGTYHSFKLSPTGNDWLTITVYGRGWTVDSSLSPIPGCFYNIKEKKIYVPPELLPVYEIIYPNLKIPATSIMKPNIIDAP